MNAPARRADRKLAGGKRSATPGNAPKHHPPRRGGGIPNHRPPILRSYPLRWSSRRAPVGRVPPPGAPSRLVPTLPEKLEPAYVPRTELALFCAENSNFQLLPPKFFPRAGAAAPPHLNDRCARPPPDHITPNPFPHLCASAPLRENIVPGLPGTIGIVGISGTRPFLQILV